MLVLASKSCARNELLRQLGVSFCVEPSDIDETPKIREKPENYVMRIAAEKAKDIFEKHLANFKVKPILAADTIVSVGTRILRKAKDANEVRSQMKLLSGRRHRVYTGLALYLPTGILKQRLCTTHVTFKRLKQSEIEYFVDSMEWKDVAVYRYDKIVARFISYMRGLPSTIAGLPLFDTYQLLHGCGLMEN